MENNIVYEAEIDDDEIRKSLELIDKEQELAEKSKEEIVEVKPTKDISIDDITQLAMDSYKDIQQKSDEIYDAFYGVVATRQDRSDVSKQMLTDSQRLKIESITALAQLANAKAKLIQAQNKAATGNVGVFVNTKAGEDVGINLASLKD